MLHFLRLMKCPVRCPQTCSVDEILLFLMGIPSIITLLAKDYTGVLYQFFSILQMLYYMQFARHNAFLRKYASTGHFYELILSLVDILLFVFTFSCVFNSVEVTTHYSFLESIYFAIATITTTGYGDMIPKTVLGRLTTVLMMIFVAVWLPNKVQIFIYHNSVLCVDFPNTICSHSWEFFRISDFRETAQSFANHSSHRTDWILSRSSPMWKSFFLEYLL